LFHEDDRRRTTDDERRTMCESVVGGRFVAYNMIGGRQARKTDR
jgi:hypothetical protein